MLSCGGVRRELAIPVVGQQWRHGGGVTSTLGRMNYLADVREAQPPLQSSKKLAKVLKRAPVTLLAMLEYLVMV